jgi:high-affinity iron transporter
MFLATTLSGKGMHALQEAGVASMSVFPVKLRIEILGIFPSWETFISQILVLGASIFIWKMAGKKPTSL